MKQVCNIHKKELGTTAKLSQTLDDSYDELTNQKTLVNLNSWKRMKKKKKKKKTPSQLPI